MAPSQSYARHSLSTKFPLYQTWLVKALCYGPAPVHGGNCPSVPPEKLWEPSWPVNALSLSHSQPNMAGLWVFSTFWGLNSGPPACKVSTLQAGPSPPRAGPGSHLTYSSLFFSLCFHSAPHQNSSLLQFLSHHCLERQLPKRRHDLFFLSSFLFLSKVTNSFIQRFLPPAEARIQSVARRSPT